MDSSFLSRTTRTALVALALAYAPSALAQPAPTPPPGEKPAPPPAPGAVAEARKLSDAFVSVAERVSPSVVQIDVTARDENADQVTRLFGKNQDSPIARGTGSGVIFTADG